jgi:hypothetical protein
MARQQNILAFVVGIALGLGHAAVPAQSSVGFAEYYVMGDEADIITAYKTDTGIPGSGVPTTATAANIDSRLSIVSSAAGVNVYVDEWENGYGFSQSNPVGTADARWDNGPAGPNKQGGALAQGQVLTFSETTTFAPGSEGIDGGDRIFITGAPVTMVRNIWPDDPGPYIAGSWELFPTVAWQSDYQVPVGEDLNVSTVMNPGANNGGDLWIPFEYTFVFFTVEEDNTRVVVTEPGGTVRYNQVLGQGDSGAVLRIPSGTTVTGRDATTGDPVRLQAGIITSVNENIDTRYYTLTPDAFIGNDYYLPVPSMRTYFYEPSGGNLPVVAGAFVYTLQADTDIRIETATTSMVVNVPNQGQVYRFVMPEMPAGVFGGPTALESARSIPPTRSGLSWLATRKKTWSTGVTKPST